MKSRSSAAYLVSLVLLSVFFWSEMVFLNKIPFYRDIILQFYPWQIFANNSISAGVVPLWNNFSGCGTPFIANLQSAVFYPFKLIFYLLPFVPAVKIFIITHFILAAFFMFYLVRDFKVSGRAAFFAALIFAFNGYMVSRVEFFSVLASSVWVPLIILMLKKLIDTGKYKFLAFSALALSMPIFAGSVQIYFYNFIIALAFVIWYSRSVKKEWRGSTGLFISAMVLSLLISAIQLLPFVEFVMSSVRQAGMPYSFASNWSLYPTKLINFLTPFIWGNPSVSAYYGSDQLWVSCFYCGIPSIILILAYFTMRFSGKFKDVGSGKLIGFFSVILFLFVLISFGKYGLLHWLLYQIVLPFRMIRYPGVAMYAVVFSTAIVSGLIIEKLPLLAVKKNEFKKIAYSITGLILLLVAVGLYMNLFKKTVDPVRLRVANDSIFIGIAMMAAVIFLIYLFVKKRLTNTALLTAFSLLLFFDLFVNSGGIIPLLPPETVLAQPKTAEYLKADSTDFRVDMAQNTLINYRLLYQDDRRHLNGYPYKNYIKEVKEILHENSGILAGIESSEVYDPMRISRHDKFFGYLMGQKMARETPLLDLANIKYLLSNQEILEKGYVKRAKIGRLKIFENQNVLPRAYVVYNTENTANSAETFQKLIAKEFVPSETAIVEGENTEYIKSKGQKYSTAGAIYLSANTVRVNFNAAGPGVLVLLDAYYPGWEARVDGIQSKILRTNYMFRGVLVPAGVHTVEFNYRPLSFRAGAAITISTLVLLMLAMVWLWAKKISL